MNSKLRDALGRYVRATWIAWARTQPDPKPSWLVPYDELPEHLKEADRCIGEAVWKVKDLMEAVVKMSPLLVNAMIAGANPNCVIRTANPPAKMELLSIKWSYLVGGNMPALVRDTWKPEAISAALRIISAGYAKFDHDKQCLVMLRKITVNEFQKYAADFALVPIDKSNNFSMEVYAANECEKDALNCIERWSQKIPGVDVKIFDNKGSGSNVVRLTIESKPSVN